MTNILSIITNYDPNIDKFILNLGKLELKIELFIIKNALLNNFNINKYHSNNLQLYLIQTENINNVISLTNSSNILYIEQPSINISENINTILLANSLSNNTYYTFNTLITDKDNKSYVIENNKLISDINTKHTDLIYENNELQSNNDFININSYSILMNKLSWCMIGIHSSIEQIIYKCINNNFEQCVLGYNLNNTSILLLEDRDIITPNLLNYKEYNLEIDNKFNILQKSEKPKTIEIMGKRPSNTIINKQLYYTKRNSLQNNINNKKQHIKSLSISEQKNLKQLEDTIKKYYEFEKYINLFD